MPVEKNAELCNFIRIEQRKKKGMEDREGRGGGMYVGEKGSENGNGWRERGEQQRRISGPQWDKLKLHEGEQKTQGGERARLDARSSLRAC